MLFLVSSCSFAKTEAEFICSWQGYKKSTDKYIEKLWQIINCDISQYYNINKIIKCIRIYTPRGIYEEIHHLTALQEGFHTEYEKGSNQAQA